MNIISKTFALLPIALLLGFGVSVCYLFAIMFYMTGRLPDVSGMLIYLSGLEQIVEAFGG